MIASTLLTLLAIIVTLLTALVYLLQSIELLEKRISQFTTWVEKRKHKRLDQALNSKQSTTSHLEEDVDKPNND